MRSLIWLLSLVLSSISYANIYDSPVGQWRTTTDVNSKDAGIIEIYEKDGLFFGKILKNGPNSALQYCQHCPEDFKDKPVLGMTFMWGFAPKSPNNWAEGKVIDPRDGKIYNASMELSQDGEVLHFRGYWCIFWSTQDWTRVS